MKFTVSRLLILQTLHTKCCKDCSFWEGVNARRTTHDEQKPIGKDHSGDLIRSLQAVMVTWVSKNMYRHINTPPFTITTEKNAPYCFSKFNICQRIYRQHFYYLSFLLPSISSRHYLTIQTNWNRIFKIEHTFTLFDLLSFLHASATSCFAKSLFINWCVKFI